MEEISCMEEVKNIHTYQQGNQKGTGHFWEIKRCWEVNIKIELEWNIIGFIWLRIELSDGLLFP
jgi:hypothetical protein